MPDGFKLLDAYVEVHADGKGVAGKVADDIHRESGSRLGGAGSRMGGNLLGGLRGAFNVGAVGGLVGGVVGGVTSGLTSIIGSAVSDIGGMLVTVGGQVASTVIDFNSQLQNSTIGFETMLGSGKRAKSFMDDLQNFAKTTPFEFTSLVSNAQLMMGMGIAAKDVIPDLTALGDSVAAMGGSADQVNSVTLAFSQMASKGTLDMGNMTQLLQGGVPSALKVLASSYHVTTGRMTEMISNGDVLAKDALPRLVRGIERGTKATRGLGGMMDKQSQTFTGALSNISDGVTQMVAKTFKPFFDTSSRGLQRFASALSGKPAEKFSRDVTKTLRPFAKEIDKWFKGIDINKVFTTASKVLKGLFKDVKPKDLGKALKDFGHDAGDVFKSIQRVAPKVLKAIKEIGPTIGPTVKGFVDLFGAFADMIDWFVKTEDAYNKWHAEAKANFDAFFADADKFWNDVGAGWDGFWSDLGASIANGWDQIVGAFQNGGKQITDFMGGLPGALATIGKQAVDGFIGGLSDAWGGITSWLHDAAMKLPEPVRKALGVASPSKVFKQIGHWVAKGLHQGLLGGVDDIRDAGKRMAEAITDSKDYKGTELGHKMVAAIRKHIHTLVGLAKEKAKAIEKLNTDKDYLAGLRADRKDYAANVRSGIMSTGSAPSIFGDLMQTQRDKRDEVKEANKALQPTQAAMGLLNGQAYQPSWTVAPTLAKVPKVSAHKGLLDLKKNLKKLLADTKKFSKDMSTLAKMGIDPFTYDEIMNAGVHGGGLETAEAFIKDPALAKQIFTLERQISAAGRDLGNKTANHRYGERIADAKDQIKLDRDEVHQINVTMVVEAKKIDEVDKLIKMVKSVKPTARKGKK